MTDDRLTMWTATKLRDVQYLDVLRSTAESDGRRAVLNQVPYPMTWGQANAHCLLWSCVAEAVFAARGTHLESLHLKAAYFTVNILLLSVRAHPT